MKGADYIRQSETEQRMWLRRGGCIRGIRMEQYEAHSWEEEGVRENCQKTQNSWACSQCSQWQLGMDLPCSCIPLSPLLQSLHRTASCPAPALVPLPLPIHLSNPDSTSQGSIINQFLKWGERDKVYLRQYSWPNLVQYLPISSAALGIGENNPTAQSCCFVWFRHITK